jgi:hypothetical protein
MKSFEVEACDAGNKTPCVRIMALGSDSNPRDLSP